MQMQSTTFINYGHMGVTIFIGNNYGTVTGATFNGTPNPQMQMHGMIYNYGTNFNYQAGVGVIL